MSTISTLIITGYDQADIMWRILQGKQELQMLQQALYAAKSPYRLQILGLIRTSLQGPRQYEAVVDQWPQFSAILMRPSSDPTKTYPQNKWYVYTGDTTNMGGFEKLLRNKRVVNWNEPFTVARAALHFRDVFKRVASDMCGHINHQNYFFYIYAGEFYLQYDPFENPGILPRGFTAGVLSQSHAQYMYEAVKDSPYTGDADSLDDVLYTLSHRKTGAVFNEKGNPVAWCYETKDGSIGDLFVFPTYRGKNLAAVATAVLIRNMKQNTEQTEFYSYVHSGNVPMKRSTVDKIPDDKLAIALEVCALKYTPGTRLEALL